MHGFCFLIISDESKGENQNEKDDKWMNEIEWKKMTENEELKLKRE